MSDFYISYGNIIYLLWIISGMILLRWILSLAYKYYKEKKLKNVALKELESLNQDEMMILQLAVSNNAKTISGTINFHAFISMIKKGLLEPPNTETVNSLEVPFTIKSFIWEKIKDDPKFKSKHKKRTINRSKWKN